MIVELAYSTWLTSTRDFPKKEKSKEKRRKRRRNKTATDKDDYNIHRIRSKRE